MNLFQIRNLKELSCAYQLFEIRGLPSGDHFYRNVYLLTKNLAYELQMPVALTRREDQYYVAVPTDAQPRLEQPLTPHVATLVPYSQTERLDFSHLNPDTLPIALSFLQYAFRTPLMRHNDLWGSGRTYFHKSPLNASEPDREVDIFGGFYHMVVALDNARMFLLVDLTYKYVDTMFLLQRAQGGNLNDFRLRHCLYQFGHRWYRIQLRGLTGNSIGEQKFKDERTGEIRTVYDHTRNQCSKPWPDYIQTLDPNSPAILYRYPGSGKERYGAAALCRLLYPTDDPRVKAIHPRSAREPTSRFQETVQIVGEFFGDVYLGETRVQVAPVPHKVPKRYFPVPDQRFGHNTVLHVKRYREDDGIDIKELGFTRLEYLASPEIGPLGASELPAQYIFIPQSLPRNVGEHFQEEFRKTLQQFSPYEYQPIPILYDDRQARSLRQQVKAFEDAVQTNGIKRGYALLILPVSAAKDLHNYLKRCFWPALQFQCATARKILSFYQQVTSSGQPTYTLKPDPKGKFASYLRNTAFGLLNVNRMWPWALETPLHYEAYVGIDVLNGRAGFTFVFQNARQCFFEDFPSKQKEKLTRNQMATILHDTLYRHLTTLRIRPRSLVIHRDGCTYGSEQAGIQQAVRQLKSEELLPDDVIVGVVDIRKTSAFRLRIVEERTDGSLVNPRIGAYYVSQDDSREGFVCNTGWPFDLPGTAKPLHACIIVGDLNIHWVVEDIFALSQLIWAAPDRCARLPLTIKLADDFLEPIAAEADEEKALYGDEGEPDEEDNEDVVASVDLTVERRMIP